MPRKARGGVVDRRLFPWIEIDPHRLVQLAPQLGPTGISTWVFYAIYEDQRQGAERAPADRLAAGLARFIGCTPSEVASSLEALERLGITKQGDLVNVFANTPV